jgi:bifunctional non-homologous end joining protein LigD
MLPSLVEAAPDGAEWLHEIKYDGYRTQLAIDGRDIRAFTRNGHDWTDRYAPVVTSARGLRCQSAIIDGEMCVQNEAGVTDFRAFRRSIESAPHRLVLFAFDLLLLDGRDLRDDPLIDRRRRLQDLIGVDMVTRIHFSGHHAATGQPSSGLPISTASRASFPSEPTAAAKTAGRMPG